MKNAARLRSASAQTLWAPVMNGERAEHIIGSCIAWRRREARGLYEKMAGETFVAAMEKRGDLRFARVTVALVRETGGEGGAGGGVS